MNILKRIDVYVRGRLHKVLSHDHKESTCGNAYEHAELQHLSKQYSSLGDHVEVKEHTEVKTQR